MDPTTLALLNAGSSVLGKALGAPKSDGPSSAQSGDVWQQLDHGGWTVSYGSSGLIGSSSSPSLLWLVALGVAAWYLVKA